jgi:hypothetical protein
MNRRLGLLDWLIAMLQHLADDHRTTHGLWPAMVRRYRQFFRLKENRQYHHALFRRPQSEIVNPKSAIE